ncbi:hypothetical protein B0H11DRAFT_1910734 [Mycena galericulata]|nr:hypothetical protein B0H11DRAFT_1910734 [Mycena galericulata]
MSVPDMDWPLVIFTGEQVQLSRSHGNNTVVGWLFPDGQHIQRCIWVKVPILGSASRAEKISDLDLDLWMDAGRGGSVATVDFTGRILQVDRFPHRADANDLRHLFSIVITPQDTTGDNVQPLNHLINTLVPGLHHPWRGNVLVFCHGSSTQNVIVNMEKRYSDTVSRVICTKMSSSKKRRTAEQPIKSRSASIAIPVSQASAFWNLDDIVLYTLRFLGLIHLLKFAHINRRTASLAKNSLRRRVIRYTSPFFRTPRPTLVARSDTDLRRFFQTLETTNSWIVGSVPLAAACLLSDVGPPNNLNVITKSTRLSAWFTFLVHETGFRVISHGPASGAYQRAGHIFVRFVHDNIPGMSVSVTTTRCAHLGFLFFASPNTDQHIAIAAYELITPFLGAVSLQEHVQGFWRHERRHHSIAPPARDETYHKISRFPDAVRLHVSTDKWTHPCGNICPGLQRSAAGLHGFAHIKWGGMDDLDDYTDPALEEIGCSEMQFRTGTRCQNTNCTGRRRKGLLQA